RPSVAYQGDLNTPSTLLLALDKSESMTIQDEYDNLSRWQALQRMLREAEPHLKKLEEEQNTTIVRYHFAEDATDYAADIQPDGKRTDFGQMLHALGERHGRDRDLRGLLILSDGADNGVRYPPLTEAARWRSLPCPIFTFAVGKPTTSDRQKDIGFVG